MWKDRGSSSKLTSDPLRSFCKNTVVGNDADCRKTWVPRSLPRALRDDDALARLRQARDNSINADSKQHMWAHRSGFFLKKVET
jgi:hypothetical protein